METPLLGSVLIFGGCGFLGHHIAKQAKSAPDVTQVTIFDLDTSKNRVPGVEYVNGSIVCKEDVEMVFEKVQPNVVFHTVSPDPFSKNHKLFQAVNVDGTCNVLACAQKNDNTKAFVYTSSSSVIHNNWTDLVMATEASPVIFAPEQKEFYSHTKAVAETRVLATNGDRIRTAAIRPAGLFGEGDTGTVTRVISNAREGKARLQIGNNSNLFDWTYVGNNVHAQLLAARALVRSYEQPKRDATSRVDGEAFVITNDEPWHFWTFTRALAAAAGFPVAEKDVIAVPWRVMMVIAWFLEWGYWVVTFGKDEPRLSRARVKYTSMERTLDITKAKQRLGYRPLIDMQEGIDRAARWFVEQSS